MRVCSSVRRDIRALPAGGVVMTEPHAADLVSALLDLYGLVGGLREYEGKEITIPDPARLVKFVDDNSAAIKDCLGVTVRRGFHKNPYQFLGDMLRKLDMNTKILRRTALTRTYTITSAARTRRAAKCHLRTDLYEQLNTAQSGVCAICGLPPVKKKLCVDHDHDTGAVRGLLCSRCNLGLGFFLDSPASLIKAATYLTTAVGRQS